MPAKPLSLTPLTQPAGSTPDLLMQAVLSGYPTRYQPHAAALGRISQVDAPGNLEPTLPAGIAPETCKPVDTPFPFLQTNAAGISDRQSAIRNPQSITPGFSGARVWRVETPAGACCLRAMPEAPVEFSRLRGLHRLLAHVHSAGVEQVAVPLTRSDGATFCTRDNFVWQLEPWMPGSADFWCHPSEARLTSAMHCLARWHMAAAEFCASHDERSWFFVAAAACSPGLAERSQRFANWNAAACDAIERRLAADDWTDFRDLGRRIVASYRRVAPAIVRDLELAAHVSVPLQPCLRDVWHDHVLFTGEEVTGLIDAHACRSDSVATDLARLLGSLLADDRLRWDAALAAYEQLRPLSIDERGLVELFDASGVALSGLTWLEWRYLQKRQFAEPDRVLERLELLRRRLDTLASRH